MRISDLDLGWTAEQVHEVVATQFPQFAAETPSVLGRGWDNVCVIYLDGTVFRLPTRQMGGEIMVIECAVLPMIADKLSLSVPKFQFFGQPSGGYPWQFVGYQLLPGKTCEQLAWTSSERLQAAATLGAFLSKLHAIPVTAEIESALPHDQLDRSSGAANLRRVQKYRGQVLEEYPDRADWANHLLAIATDLADAQPEPRLAICHGDLYPRHVLADGTKQVTGVIDWGDINLGHPLMDLSIAYSFLDPEERNEFWSAYGRDVSTEEKALARLKALNYALALFLYGSHSGDAALLELVDQIALRVATE